MKFLKVLVLQSWELTKLGQAVRAIGAGMAVKKAAEINAKQSSDNYQNQLKKHWILMVKK